MGPRRTKQAIYGAVYAVVAIVVITYVYFWLVKPAASCFDGIQNQGEAGVDCGGPCAQVCLPANLQKISVLGGVQVFNPHPASSALPIRYALLAQVANSNSGLAARSFDYRFDLYNATGTVIQSVTGRSFAYAGEVKYLFVPDVSAPAPVSRATLTVMDPDWAAAATLGIVPQFGNPLPVTASIISSSTVTVSGRITNSDVSAFNNVLVVAILRGPGNVVVGASQTVIDHIAPNETQTFSVMYPAGPAIDPQLTQLYAYALRP
jgi:hypothetical protein